MKSSRLIKIATGILLTVTLVLPQILSQTVFAVSSSSLYKVYGQVSPIVEQSSSSNYEINAGGVPIAGEISSANYNVQDGTIYGGREEGITPTTPTTTTGGSPLPIVGGGGGSGINTTVAGAVAAPTTDINVIGLKFTEIAPDRVKVVFNTDDLAVAHLQYSDEDFVTDSILEFALKLQHEFVIEDLTPGTTYKFTIKLRDMYFNITESGEFVFTTPTMNYKYFIDVPNDQWFAPYVNALVTAGCLDTANGYYYPGDDLTRAHAVKMLVCAGGLEAGVPGHPTFKDVSLGYWAYSAVEIAYTHNVIDGYSGDRAGYFGPDDPITREQFAKMVSETFNLPIVDACNMFGDSNTIEAWACQFVGTAYAWSIVDGYPDGTYGPQRHINRAEGAKMIANGANPVLRAGIEIGTTDTGTGIGVDTGVPGGVIGQGINIDVEAEIVEGGAIGEGIVGEGTVVGGEEGGIIGEGLDVGDAPAPATPVTTTPTAPADEIVEIEIEIGPGGEIDYGLVDGTTGDEDLSDVMDYLLEALQDALEGR